MAKLGIKDAFAKYSAVQRNVQWSVSAWTPGGELVVSVWAHHQRPNTPGVMEFEACASRWDGPGNKEFRENVKRAFETNASLRLVIAETHEIKRVEASEDASKIKKEFSVRTELVGTVVEWDGDRYLFRFEKAVA
jgi:hypothetical protein